VRTVLEVTGLYFSFERNRPVLQNIEFQVSEGECLGIVGGNGAGKSTLLWCLLGLLKASGSIRFFGEEISKRALARIAIVFQNPEDQLFMPALLDDVTLPLVNRGLGITEAQRMALDKLDKLGLGDCAGRPATKLSIGEQKRASIAAAVSTSPELLLLDEPTAELDGRSARQLADLLAQLAVTTIVTSHHLDFLRTITCRTLVLSKGRIIADGPTPDMLGNQSLLQAADLI
jgi:cobalt/nickel transport system ATP-binding protein